MRKLALALPLIALLLLAACGGTTTTSGGGNSSTITMAGSSFTGNTSITIKAGQAVTFADTDGGGGTHNLVTGTNGQFAAATGAPTEFAASSGVNFNPGDTKQIVFPNAGTYNITCTIHFSMQATITVTP